MSASDGIPTVSPFAARKPLVPLGPVEAFGRQQTIRRESSCSDLPSHRNAAAVLSLALVAAAPLPAAPPASDRYTVTPLASNIPGVAPTTDANLVNGWGLARSGDEPVVGRRQRRATRRRSTTAPARSR